MPQSYRATSQEGAKVNVCFDSRSLEMRVTYLCDNSFNNVSAYRKGFQFTIVDCWTDLRVSGPLSLHLRRSTNCSGQLFDSCWDILDLPIVWVAAGVVKVFQDLGHADIFRICMHQ